MNRKSGAKSLICVCMLICTILLTCLPFQFVFAKEPVKIAFIDTGISTKYIDASDVAEGKNYIFPDRDTQDRDGHGTATAGMVLGSSILGLEGSCPNAVAVPLVIYDRYPSGVSNIGDVYVMCEAIYDAVDIFGCKVINLSMGITAESEELRLAVEYAEKNGVVVVSAVGNDNMSNPDRKYYPACYDTVIGVGALADSVDDYIIADFSQRNGVSVSAKGVNIKTATNRNSKELSVLSGTSYACAYVAGLCAQILTDSPYLTPSQVRTLVYASALDIGVPGVDNESGWGVVGINGTNFETVTAYMLASLLYEYDGNRDSDAINFINIISGYESNKSEPYNITREQMATVLYQYAKYKNYDVSLNQNVYMPFLYDINNVSRYAVTAIEWACGSGIIQDNDGYLIPQGNITKQELISILLRLSQNFS